VTGESRPAATRSSLLKLERRLGHVRRASGLLRRKREVLVAELMRHARPTIDARGAIDTAAAAAYEPLVAAMAEHGRAGLSVIGLPGREVRVGLELVEVWGERVPALVDRPRLVRSVAARATAPGMTGTAAVDTAVCFERLVELLLDAVSDEAALQRLGEAVAQATRQVNALEQRIGPRLAEQRRAIAATLAERERDDHVRRKRLLRSRRDA